VMDNGGLPILQYRIRIRPVGYMLTAVFSSEYFIIFCLYFGYQFHCIYFISLSTYVTFSVLRHPFMESGNFFPVLNFLLNVIDFE